MMEDYSVAAVCAGFILLESAQWSDDQMIRWSDDQMIKLSDDQMIRWSHDHMITWSHDSDDNGDEETSVKVVTLLAPTPQ